MNIFYCCDDKYSDMARISASSFLRHNPDAKFYFINSDKFQDLKEFDESLCGYKHVSKACFLRLLIPKYFPEFERGLYVDCDTICKGNISEFYNTDFENNYIIGCEGIEYSKKQAKELNIPFYINSGVLLFNIPLMNKESYFEQVKKHYKECLGLPKIFSADETIINYVFNGKIKKVSEKYNYCHNRNYGERVINPDEVKIWHVTGANKRAFYEL